MYDYRMVFVYPLRLPLEELSEIESFATSELEKSISNTVDDGWEYLKTSTFKQGGTESGTPKTGIRAFVYRKLRVANAEFSGPEAAAILQPQIDKSADRSYLKAQCKHSEHSVPKSKSTIMMLALLNALKSHSDVRLSDALTNLQNEGEITQDERTFIEATLVRNLSAAELAAMVPENAKRDAFRASVMTFAEMDAEYQDYIAELAVYLDLDDAFVTQQVAMRQP